MPSDSTVRADGTRACTGRAAGVDVKAGDVSVGAPVQDPVGEHATDAAAGQDADRVQASSNDVVPQLWGFAEDGAQVGVKLSGPQKNLRTPMSSEVGTRRMAFSRYGPMRSQSG